MQSRRPTNLHDELIADNLVPRSHSVTGNVRSGKVRFRACSASEARNTGFSFTAHVRTLCCDFGLFCGINMDFESILEEILLGRGQGNL